MTDYIVITTAAGEYLVAKVVGDAERAAALSGANRLWCISAAIPWPKVAVPAPAAGSGMDFRLAANSGLIAALAA